jgi:ribose-phosphate pyrophosphokinase
MIKIQTLDQIENTEYIVKPTIFPDGTSQVWHLPEEIINSLNLKITWNFEAERELIDIRSLRALTLKNSHVHCHIPYLPYARQDKSVTNDTSFNLDIFGEILNLCEFNLVTAVDVHNKEKCYRFIKNFQNIPVTNQINKLANNYDVVLFPDQGAAKRYSTNIQNSKQFTCTKERDQTTGQLLSHKCPQLNYGLIKSILMVDDICDGGATFISVANMLKEQKVTFNIALYVTHGIFSKGKQVLYDAGIQNIYTTNSLLKNTEGFKV